jgi:hypothetical protein
MGHVLGALAIVFGVGLAALATLLLAPDLAPLLIGAGLVVGVGVFMARFKPPIWAWALVGVLGLGVLGVGSLSLLGTPKESAHMSAPTSTDMTEPSASGEGPAPETEAEPAADTASATDNPLMN